MAGEVELHWTEIDGVRTVWADTHRPFCAGLMFRAGRAHETLVTSGHTHLVEHMAVAATGCPPDRVNGVVAGAFTAFWVTDSPEAVCAFLFDLSRALRTLPGSRLESEKQVLEAEAASRAYSFFDNLLMWRYGAAGYGLFGLRELGTRHATLTKLQSLAAERFTAENAVLWLSGPPPAGLRLDLPHGTKLPTPALEPILPASPSWFLEDHCGGIAASATVPRASAATLFNLIAQKRLHQQLRVEKALSYSPSVSYDPLDGKTAHLVIHADSEQERRRELADAFDDFFEKLILIEEAELESARAELLAHWAGPLAPPAEERALGEVQRAAADWALGMKRESNEELAAGWAKVTIADVTAMRLAVYNTALFALPGPATARPLNAQPAPPSTTPEVEGRQVASKDAPVDKTRLVSGPQGITLRWPDGSTRSVRYNRLVGALSYQDGGIVLIGRDAGSISVEPTMWRDGPRVCKEIRERVPAHLLLDRGERPAEAIPKPETTRWQRVNAWIKPRRWPLAGAVFVLVASALLIALQQWEVLLVLLVAFARLAWGLRPRK